MSLVSHQAHQGAFTIAEFCAAYRVSRSSLYNMWAEGTGPRRMKLGSKNLISYEAAAEWAHSLEAKTEASTETV